jgi:hypothetical protein
MLCEQHARSPVPGRRRLVWRMGLIALVTPIVVSCLLVGVAHAATFLGKTSQGKRVRAGLSGHGKLASLIVELSVRCTDKRTRVFGIAFVPRFAHPQDAVGNVGDSYDIVGKDLASGVRFRQRATFSGRVTRNRVTGIAQGAETLLPTGVTCRSHRVRFRVHV